MTRPAPREFHRLAGPATALGENAYRVTASTPDLARDGMEIPVSAWDLASYERNPIVLFAHRRDDLDAVLGQATVEKTANALEATIQFLDPGVSAFADQVRRLWDAGVLRAVSVGASIRAAEPVGDHLRVTDAELLDLSIVPIGGDSGALSAARSLGAALEIDAATIDRVFNINPQPTHRPRLSAGRNRIRLLESCRRL